MGVGNHQIVRVQGAFFFVQGDQFFPRMCLADHQLVAADAVGVEGVQGVAQLVEHPVGGVHQVVDGLEAHGLEARLKVFGGRLHADAFDQKSVVARARCFVLHANRNGRNARSGAQRCN